MQSASHFGRVAASIVLALCCGAVGAQAQRAQDVTLTLSPRIPATALPATGAGVDTTPFNGGQEVKAAGERLQVGPSPAQGRWTTSLGYESWSARGARIIGGSRGTITAAYTLGLSSESEAAVVLPLQSVSLDGAFGSKTGVGDVEMAYRRFFFDPGGPGGATYTASARLFLPTGDFGKGIGLGKFSYGLSGLVSKPFGEMSLACAGLGYTLVGKPEGLDARNVLYLWAGGVTQFRPRWGLQYELAHYNSPADESYTRALVGARYTLAPTRGIELSVKQELQADGKPITVTLGYSARL